MFWQGLLDETKGSGTLPVCLGTTSNLIALHELAAYCTEDFETLCQRGMALDVPAWFESRQAEDPGYYGFNESVTFEKAVLCARFSPAYGLSGRPVKEAVVFGLIPVAHPWQIPAYLKAGEMNECPGPDVQTAVMKYWFERYGARPIVVSFDTYEFEVERPPQSFDDALVLAREQFIYCGDIVHQGVETVGNLATSLVGSNHWYFWWD